MMTRVSIASSALKRVLLLIKFVLVSLAFVTTTPAWTR